VAQEVVPFLQTVGLVVQGVAALQETQLPAPSQTRLLPQPMPAPLLLPSTQVWAPVPQEVVPLRQMPGFVVQEAPAVQETHVPEALQTRLGPQVVPAVLALPSTHIWAPVVHEATPLSHMVGFPEQLCPWVQVPQNPFPSQTWFIPQGVPDPT